MVLAQHEAPRRGATSRKILHLLLALAVVAVPAARAAPACSAVTDQPPNAAGVYVLAQSWEVWLEGNGAPGLQRQACERDDTQAQTGSDTFILDAAAALG